MLLLRLSQGIASGCNHATPTPFFNCRYLGKWALYFCFDLAKVFLQGATTPPVHIFLQMSLFWEVDVMLVLRLSQGISSGCHNANPTPKKNFWICHWWKGT